ncbi:hypothetical protein SOVF_031200 [Spinacia oleracea]|nr:hypothetical protein SOVF_031200 [Spinacia oleracea]
MLKICDEAAALREMHRLKSRKRWTMFKGSDLLMCGI